MDNAAATPILPAVRKVANEAMENFGNASSLHEEGRLARAAITNAREVVAELIGAKPEEIIFTNGCSEANNTVIKTFNKLAVSAIEHPSVLEPARKLGAQIIPVDAEGMVQEDTVKKLASQSDLVSIMLANNEIGTIQDIKKLARIAHENQALFHTDATQAVGKVPIDVKDLGVDYLTMSAHKIGGLKGIGALYMREGCPLEPLVCGGRQEKGLRAGTENTLGIIAFGEACKNCFSSKDHYTKVAPLRRQLREGIVKNIPNVTVNGDQENCLPNILSVTFAGVEGESVMLMLDAKGVAVSTGSACATGDIRPSHVLMAIGADPEKAHGSIRFSLGADTTKKDINYVLEVLPPIITFLRKISTVEGDYE